MVGLDKKINFPRKPFCLVDIMFAFQRAVGCCRRSEQRAAGPRPFPKVPLPSTATATAAWCGDGSEHRFDNEKKNYKYWMN